MIVVLLQVDGVDDDEGRKCLPPTLPPQVRPCVLLLCVFLLCVLVVRVVVCVGAYVWPFLCRAKGDTAG